MIKYVKWRTKLWYLFFKKLTTLVKIDYINIFELNLRFKDPRFVDLRRFCVLHGAFVMAVMKAEVVETAFLTRMLTVKNDAPPRQMEPAGQGGRQKWY